MKLKINIRKYAYFIVAFFGIFWISTIAVEASTANTTITSVLSPVISLLTTTGSVSLNVTPTSSGAQTIGSDTVTVSTNDSNGYTLSLADNTTNTNLISGSNNIAASAASQGTPAVQLVNTWGYCVASIGGFGANCPSASAASQAISASNKFAGMPSSASPNTIATTATTATNATTTVWYAVAANTTQPSGSYSTTVTYTAITN